MQNRDPLKDDSYFQLSGTHGYPFVEWAKRNRTIDVKSKRYGYCAHSQVLFPTWHRITTVAFEVRCFLPFETYLFIDPFIYQ